MYFFILENKIWIWVLKLHGHILNDKRFWNFKKLEIIKSFDMIKNYKFELGEKNTSFRENESLITNIVNLKNIKT